MKDLAGEYLFGADTQWKRQPMRRWNARIYGMGALDTTAKVVSGCARWMRAASKWSAKIYTPVVQIAQQLCFTTLTYPVVSPCRPHRCNAALVQRASELPPLR